MQNKFLHCVTSALVGIFTFRVANPYAFEGWGINPHWIEWLKLQLELAKPNVNYPPSVQWFDNPWYNSLYDMIFYGMGFGAFFLCVISLAALRYSESRALWLLCIAFCLIGILAPNHYLRYQLPAYPILFILAGFAAQKNRIIGKLAMLCILTSIAGSMRFSSIYRRDHTRVEAAKWVRENLPPGKVAYETAWDDKLPIQTVGDVDLNLFSRQFPDTAGADYIFITSRRVLGSAGRLYPETRRFYERLFSGALGFKLVKFITAGLKDESADESFQVYDHPDVFIFAKIKSPA